MAVAEPSLCLSEQVEADAFEHTQAMLARQFDQPLRFPIRAFEFAKLQQRFDKPPQALQVQVAVRSFGEAAVGGFEVR